MPVLALLALAVPVALAARPNQVLPGQKVDLKVLLLSADGTQPGFGAWKAALDREGIPYDTFQVFSGQTRVAPALTDERLADYGAQHAKYSAVILESGDLGHTVNNANGTVSFLSALGDTEWAALAKFERTFGIRQLSDNTFPAPLHGLNPVGASGSQDGAVGTLTAAGKAAFPYLKGPVPIANDDPATAETFGVAATPVTPDAWQPLVAAPGGNGAYLGIYTHPEDGREEMVMTVNSNQFQSHDQLLRHGMLNWVTRGVFLGYQRSYLSLDVDDVFLPDDKWDAAANVTDYDPDHAIRMTAGDVANAVAWQRRTGLRLNLVYNMGGLEEFPTGAPELLAALQANKNEFRWVNHTLQHPNLDCSTTGYIAGQITQNQARFNALIAPAPGRNDPTEVVTGEHSGLANTRPGNPGTIDPPTFSDEPTAGTGGTLAAGTYDYGVTATTAAGETPASVAQATVAAGGRVTLSWPSVCHAASYKVYRRAGSAGAWSLLATVPVLPAASAFTDAGATNVTYTDTGAAGAAAAPPTANGAALGPYPQNPAYAAALSAAGIRTTAADASKAYPNPPTKSPVSEADPTNFPPGATFTDGPAQAVPRYPSNVYYNVANRADQLDEYNWIYVSPSAGGGCVPITGVTTCRTSPATWQEYLTSETNIMFRHLMGNDPRPHFFHQTNLAQSSATAADSDTSVGGTLYAVLDTLVGRYDTYVDRALAPLIQLGQTDAAATLARQATWAATAGKVSAWLQDGRVHVKNNGPAAVDVPLTGTTIGDAYAGQRSGWTSIAAGRELVLSPSDPANSAAPAVSGTARIGSTLSASTGAWAGTAPIGHAYQWRHCDAKGCSNIAGATGAAYKVARSDGGYSLRVVVHAGNWVSAVSQAASAPTAVVPKPGTAGGAADRKRGSAGHVSLTRLSMKPRRFAVAHRRKRKGARLDGSVITWRLNTAATVRLSFQRRVGRRGHRHWLRIGRITRHAKAGKGVVRFRGRFGRRLLRPRAYRLVAYATKHGRRSSHKHMTFRVVKG